LQKGKAKSRWFAELSKNKSNTPQTGDLNR
jgi:hypothetical protein